MTPSEQQISPTADTGQSAAEPSFPRMSARTLRFGLGAPHAFTLAPDGSRITFLRAPSGTDRGTELWCYDVASGMEHRVVDPASLVGTATEDLSPDERARRERSRQTAAGVVAYSTDAAVEQAAYALSSRLWLTDLTSGHTRELPATGPVIDPRLDPTGRFVAYATDGALRVIGADGTDDRVLAEPTWQEREAATVVWGQAEFIAAEELGRHRGFWWAPDGSALLVARYDESPVRVWHIADPANPDQPARATRYPSAGEQNADVSLWLIDLTGCRREVLWDRERFSYLVDVSWTTYGPALVHVLSRDQRTARVLGLELEGRNAPAGTAGAAGAAGTAGAGGTAGTAGAGEATAPVTTKVMSEQVDPAWVELVGGVPQWLPDGRLLTTTDRRHTRRLAFDGEPVTPEGFQVRSILGIDEAGALISASYEPTERHVAHVALDGTLTLLTSEPGLHHGACSTGGVLVLSSSSLDHHGLRTEVHVGGERAGEIASRQERPPFAPRVSLLKAGLRDLRTAVIFPRDHTPASRRLPVVMAPYGGPHGQSVVTARAAYLTPQWIADQGFCVVIADGRGMAGRGPTWEREVHFDFTATIDDQVEALREVSRLYPDDIDPSRVAIRGWSFGGYLAAMAVLHRPEVFHVGVAGAPVTDWRLYDTAYTERYLGLPDDKPDVYERNSVLSAASRLSRPLLLIHGMADDNVVAAHTLRLSAALLAAGRPHEVLPLSGVTHMTPQEQVAENLLRLEIDFYRRSLPRPPKAAFLE